MAKLILVVDDDPDLREAVGIILTKAGYEIAQAASAEEALRALSGGGVDLILLDVMMESDTAGFHLAYRIRQDHKHKDTPIIILTGIEEHTGVTLEPEGSGDYLPVQGYLRKPVDPDELEKKLSKLLS